MSEGRWIESKQLYFDSWKREYATIKDGATDKDSDKRKTIEQCIYHLGQKISELGVRDLKVRDKPYDHIERERRRILRTTREVPRCSVTYKPVDLIWRTSSMTPQEGQFFWVCDHCGKGAGHE